MRVLFILEDFNSSGVTNVTKLIASSLSGMGIETKLLLLRSNKVKCYPYDLSYLQNINIESSKVAINEEIVKFSDLKKVFKFILGRFFYLFFISPSQKKFQDIINSYDLIFICDLYSKFYFWKIRSENIRYVFHNVKSKQISTIGGFGKLLDLWLFKQALYLRNCITVSNTVKEDIITNFNVNPKNVVVIHNPLFFDTKQSESLNCTKEKEYFLFAGRLSTQKNIDFLIKAYSNFRINYHKSKIPDLIIIGTGPLKIKLEKMALDLKINNHVHFLGYKPNVSEFILNSKAVLLTSDYEGFPTIVIEALLHKKYVLAVPIPSLIEMKNYFEGIFLSRSHSIFSFSNLLVEFSEMGLEYHGANCLNKSEFDLNNVTKKYIGKYL